MNTTLTIERITHALDKRFSGLIDLSDLRPESPQEERRSTELSRALAALAIMGLSDADSGVAAASITDGFNDLGLDAIYFESAENTLYVVQSKWHGGGKKTIELGECNNFLEGVDALIRADFALANQRLKDRQQEIRDILLRPEVRITLVVVHTGSSPLGSHVVETLNKFLKRENNVGDAEVFTLEVFDLRRVYEHLDPDAGKKINLNIGLSEWGIVRDPYRAYYGQMKLSDVAGWVGHGKALFARNLRFYRGSTEVNIEMDNTIVGAPDSFWYFNNGITVLCETIDKAPLNGADRNWGVFECVGVSVVNGAQTVGVIWERAKGSMDFLSAADARVHVRIISLKNCPEGFGGDVTRATNTQNEIKHRDFAALDATQHNLAREMSLDGRQYAFKSGDPDPKGNDGCTIEEATIALACASGDVTMAVVAKRELGGLWKDITKPPYTTIFNERTKARDMWRAVLVSRAVDGAMAKIDHTNVERGDQILVHGNRFILHLVFQEPELRRINDPSLSDDDLCQGAVAAFKRAFLQTASAVNARHPNAYLQPLFKNTQKCKELFAAPETYGQGSLFPPEVS
jgi:hypothetical protein